MRRFHLPGVFMSGLAFSLLLFSVPTVGAAQTPEVGGTLIVVNKGAASASIVTAASVDSLTRACSTSVPPPSGRLTMCSAVTEPFDDRDSE